MNIVKYLVIFATLSSLNFATTLIPLGANVTDNNGSAQTSFAIWSPDTSNVQLWVQGYTSIYTLTNTEQYFSGNNDTTVYYITLPGDLNLSEYHFIINGTSVQDPYARMTDLNWNESNYQNNDIVIDLAQLELQACFKLCLNFSSSTYAI